MAKRDYYEVLGVGRSASAEDIRKAYRKLARQFHPDVNKSADAGKRFQEVQEAYDALSDEQKRRTYDQFGHVEPRQAGAGAPGGGGAHYTWSNVGGQGPGGVEMDMEDLGSMFEAFFGGQQQGAGPGFAGAGGRGKTRRARPRPEPQPADEHDLNVSFLTAARGGTERLRLIENGQTRTIEVTIPKGIPDGARLRVGEVVLKVRVGHHPLFRRSEQPGQSEQGLDLYLELPLTIAEATLGGRVTLPTLEEMVELGVPPGTPSGRKLRLRGKGLSDAKGIRGDFYAISRLIVPDGSELPPEDAAVLQRIASMGADPRDGAQWRQPPE